MRIKKIISFFFFTLAMTCLSTTQAQPEYQPFPPFRIIGNLYYVGDGFQADYLIVTAKGNILINSGYATDFPKLKANVEKLGFKFKDTKIFLISHAHNDHSGGGAQIKMETGAKYMVMDEDVSAIESGGRTDFRYGADPEMFYPAAKVDHILHDGERVKLGDVELVAHLTPGHTKGCTTWTTKIKENGKTYQVVIVGGTSLNTGYELVNNAKYPNIAQDYKQTFNVLRKLPCDIFLAGHGMYFDLDKKYAEMKKGNQMNPFVDPEGYKKLIAVAEQQFDTELTKQKNKS